MQTSAAGWTRFWGSGEERAFTAHVAERCEGAEGQAKPLVLGMGRGDTGKGSCAGQKEVGMGTGYRRRPPSSEGRSCHR